MEVHLKGSARHKNWILQKKRGKLTGKANSKEFSPEIYAKRQLP
jgi:hypothetical protein